MISKNRLKWLRGLTLKKHRQAEGVFVAEGPKLVGDLLKAGFECVYLAHTQQWSAPANVQVLTDFVTEDELRRASSLETPQGVLAVFRQPVQSISDDDYSHAVDIMSNSLCLALDNVQNPGNVGTIVRLADWFGVTDVFCSKSCADIYGAKAIQATMGGLARVRVHYINIYALLKAAQEKNVPVYGTFLDGDNIYGKTLQQRGVIVMGNEGNGISEDVATCVTERLFIPAFPANRETTDSLNVAVATAVVCAEFRRQAR